MSIYRNQAQRVFDFAKEKYQLPDDILSEKLGVSVDQIEAIIEKTVKQSGINGKKSADALIQIIERQFSPRISLKYETEDIVLIDEHCDLSHDKNHYVEIFLNTEKGKFRVEGLISDEAFQQYDRRYIYDHFIEFAKKVYDNQNASSGSVR